jgi:hypothetical protein
MVAYLGQQRKGRRFSFQHRRPRAAQLSPRQSASDVMIERAKVCDVPLEQPSKTVPLEKVALVGRSQAGLYCSAASASP